MISKNHWQQYFRTARQRTFARRKTRHFDIQQAEPLEVREMLAGVTAALDGTTLTIQGSEKADLISLRRFGNDLIIQHASREDGKLLSSGDFRFTVPEVSRIVVNGNDGNDHLRVTFPTPTHSLTVTLDGGSGADILEAHHTTAYMIGGSGSDMLISRGGTAYADYSPAPDGVTVNLAEGVTIDDGTGSSDSLNGINNVIGSTFADIVRGNGKDNILDGGNGNDRLYGEGGNDTLHGRQGQDHLEGGQGNDSLYGGMDNDELVGGHGDDLLSGGSGNDLLRGGIGDDTLDGGEGTDIANYARAIDDILDAAGNITVNAFDRIGISANLVNGTASGEGDDRLQGIETLIGSNGRDHLVTANAHRLAGGHGDDVFIVDGREIDFQAENPVIPAAILDADGEFADEFARLTLDLDARAGARSVEEQQLFRQNLLAFQRGADTVVAQNEQLSLVGGLEGLSNRPFPYDDPNESGFGLAGIGRVWNTFRNELVGPIVNKVEAVVGPDISRTVRNIATNVVGIAEGVGQGIVDIASGGIEILKDPDDIKAWVNGINRIVRGALTVVAVQVTGFVSLVTDAIAQIRGVWWGRGLNGPERQLLSDIFGSDINLSQVRIVENDVLCQGSACVHGTTIHFPNRPDNLSADHVLTFVHEATHVVQKQSFYDVVGRTALPQLIQLGHTQRIAVRHDWLSGPPPHEPDNIYSPNLTQPENQRRILFEQGAEAHATMVEQYYALLRILEHDSGAGSELPIELRQPVNSVLPPWNGQNPKHLGPNSSITSVPGWFAYTQTMKFAGWFMPWLERRSSTSNLRAESTLRPATSDPNELTQLTLQPIIEEGIARWQRSTDVDLRGRLERVNFRISSLSDNVLATTHQDTITIDADAAGRGWFIDSTPADDDEFSPGSISGELRSNGTDSSEIQFDLLTVVMHELGHILGLGHDEPASPVMQATLIEGVRRLPAPHETLLTPKNDTSHHSQTFSLLAGLTSGFGISAFNVATETVVFEGSAFDDELILRQSGGFLTHNATRGNFASDSDIDPGPGVIQIPITSTLRVVVDAGEGNDFVDASESMLQGLAIFGGGGNDRLIGSNARGIGDHIDGGDGDDILTGRDGDDYIFGGNGRDQIDGGRGNDFLLGGNDHDVLVMGTGVDEIDGGSGDDILVFGAPGGEFRVDSFLNQIAIFAASDGSSTGLGGASSIETLILQSLDSTASTFHISDLSGTSLTRVEVELTKGLGLESELIVLGTNRNDHIEVAEDNQFGISLPTVATGWGDVAFRGGPQSTLQIEALAGDDVVAFRDLPNLAGTAVTIHGGPGDDILSGSAGNDRVFGDDGNDVIIATGGSNVIDGGSGYDIFEISGSGTNGRIDVDQPNSDTVRHAFGVIGVDQTNVNTIVAGLLEEVRIVTGSGDNVIRVTPSDSLINDSIPELSLRFSVDGGAQDASHRLVVVDAGLGDTVIHRIGENNGDGTITIGALAPVFYSNVAHVDITPLDEITGATGSDSAGRLVVFKHDPFENNNTHSSAWHLGGGIAINVDPTIDPGGESAFDVSGDADFFRFVAAETGTLDIQVYFSEVSTLSNGRDGLPGDGNLNLVVFDSDGVPGESNPIAVGAPLFDSAGNTIGERAVVPVVRNETYFLRVNGATAEAVNSYNFTAFNIVSPVPQSVDLIATADSGRNDSDNVTNFDGIVNGPAVFEITLDDDRLDEFTNLDLRPDTIDDDRPTNTADYGIELFNNGISIGFAFLQSDNTWRFTATPGDLTEGHDNFISAAVWFRDAADPTATGRGALSESLQVTLDTVAPAAPSLMIAPSFSDTGVASQPATITDNITADSSAAFFGEAEADAVVRLWGDGASVSDGTIDASDLLQALTVAVPLDGNNAFRPGEWRSNLRFDLNDPDVGFPLDGVRQMAANATDVAGNTSAATYLDIFVDTQGPNVASVVINSAFDVFDSKHDGVGTLAPTPGTDSLDITFSDFPRRDGVTASHAAVNAILAMEVGNYRLFGDANGEVPITRVQLINDNRTGPRATATYRLFFNQLLPDDRLTLIVSDTITDDAGNRLDGETNTLAPTDMPILPSGDGVPGGAFQARFTVDSRPEIAVYGQGDIKVDINGNSQFDPTNTDASNRDLVFNIGIDTDAIFSGQFVNTGDSADGFDRLGAYGRFNGAYRWLLDFDNNGVADSTAVSGLQINGLPIAGDFDVTRDGDEIGLFDGTTWWLDTDGNNNINAGDRTFTGNMRGLPFVGDFDGDGLDDLGTHFASTNTFYFDLTSADDGTPGVLDGNWDASFVFGFSGVLERPVAGDFNLDGIDDVVLTNPNRDGNASTQTLEWYFLISDATQAVPGTVNALLQPANAVAAGGTNTRSFSPAPLGNDLFARFGNNLAAPLFGNFDPPIAKPANVAPTITAPAVFRTTSAGLPATIAVQASDPNGDELNTVARAESMEWYLDQTLGLSSGDQYWHNHFGANEKWIRDQNDKWYFITESGGLYRWSGQKSATGTLVAVLDSSVHADPTLLTNARSSAVPVNVAVTADGVTVTSTGGFDLPYVLTVTTSDGVESDSAMVMVEHGTELAIRLDAELKFHSTGNLWENWSGRDEKWFRDVSNQWYFITPDGTVTHWAKDGDTMGVPIARLDSSYYADLNLLFRAAESVDGYQYQFKAASSDFQNWNGLQERWFQGEDNRWFYILPSGEVFRWSGSRQLADTEIGQVDANFYEDLDGLYDVVDDVFADWMELMAL